MFEKSSKKTQTSKPSNYVILNDKFVLSENLILDRTFLDDQLVTESLLFLSQIEKCEWFRQQQNAAQKMQHWKTLLKQKQFNNLYHLLRAVEQFFTKNHQLEKFIKHLESFYPGRNGFFSIDLFSEQPILDANLQLEKLRLEKNMLSIESREQAKQIFDYLSQNFAYLLEKDKKESKSFEFTYDDLSYQNLQSINSFIEKRIIIEQFQFSKNSNFFKYNYTFNFEVLKYFKI